MFGKLLKNDLKAQWYSVSTVYLVAFIVAIVAECFALFSKSKIVAALAGFLVIVALAFTLLITLITVALMFHKTVFGRAGYLTLMLPVKTSSLVLSKSLSALIWLFCTQLLTIGSIILWFFQVKDLAGDAADSLEGMLSFLGVPSFFTVFVGVIVLCLTLIASIALLVQCLELAISLSNVAPLNKISVVSAILLFFIIFGILASIAAKAGNAFAFGIIIKGTSSGASVVFSNHTADAVFTEGAMQVRLTSALLQLAMAVLMHFPIVWIVRDKINVK